MVQQDLETASWIYLDRDFKVSDVARLASSENLEQIDIGEDMDPAIWPALDECIFAVRPQVKLRVYERLRRSVDLAFLADLPHLANLSADCIYTSENAETIAALPKLEHLGVGIFDLTSFEFLDAVPTALKSLTLLQTESKKPDLAPLSRFRQLETLYIEGHKKNIEVLSDLKALKTLTLRSVSTPDGAYLTPLENLRNLEFKLGGIKNFDALRDMTMIEYVEFWMVRGLADLDFLTAMTGLEILFLQALRRLERLPDMRRLRKLKTVTLYTMKGLKGIDGLAAAPALENLALIDMGYELQPEDWVPVLDSPSLKRVRFGFGSDVKNNRFADLLAARGIEDDSGRAEADL